MKYEVRIREDVKVAIFDENGNMISPDWFDWISFDGLVKGQSSYYIAVKDDKCAIFDKDGKQITEWFDRIWRYGLVLGGCEYYIACNGDNCAVYHKDGKKVSEDFSIDYIEEAEEIVFNDNIGIVEIKNYDRTVKTIEFNPIYPFKEDIIDYTKLLNI
jgi:hypothetical protein